MRVSCSAVSLTVRLLCEQIHFVVCGLPVYVAPLVFPGKFDQMFAWLFQSGIFAFLSCHDRNSNKTFWFELTVYTTLPRGCENRTQYREQDCVREQSCTLYCPASNTPPKNMTSLTSQGITWEKVFFFNHQNGVESEW